MKRLSIALVVAIAAVGLNVGIASAHDHHFATQEVTIHFSGDAYSSTFFGHVEADHAACEQNRTVKVKRVEPGKDPTIGKDTTDSNGDYSVTIGGTVPAGDYYAKAKKKVLKKTAQHHHVCDAKKSNTIPVP